MQVSCKKCPLRKHGLFDALSEDEIEFMATFKTGELEVAPNTSILAEGTMSPQFFTVLSGMGIRTKLLENGNRQVVGFVFPGDLVGLQASVMDVSGHSFDSVTEMTLCVFNRNKLWRLFESQPERAYDLTWLAAVEEHFLGEAITTIGQRSAIERLSWALLKIYQRLRAIDLGKDGSVPLPFRQRDLADALGLSLVHTNKTLKKLEQKGIAVWRDRKLTVKDIPALAAIAMDSENARLRPLL